MATGYSQLKFDIDTLKEKTRVTDTQLDQRIEQEQLMSLASLLGSYEKFVRSPGFDLTNAEIADLKDCASKHGNQLAMYEALKKWGNVIRDFTYRSLLEILISLREGALADQVCKTFIQTQASELNKEDAVSLSPAQGPPIRDTVKPNSFATGTRTADRINKFETRFINLRKRALTEITEKGVTVTEFRQTLMTLPSPITSENEDFIISKYPLFEDAKSIESIFVYLNFYLSFIDFSLLEHIIEQFGSDSLKRDMSSYAKDMRHFRMNTPVSEALDHLPRNSDLPAGYSRLKAKFAYNVQTATLEDVDTYRKGLAKRCLLSPLVLSLFDLQESSLLVTWLVPAAVGAMISDQVQKKTASFFLSNSILKLSLEGECLYSFMPMANTGESSSPMIEAGAGLTSLEPHQRIADEIKQTIDLRPYYRGLAIVVQYFLSLFHITAVLTRKLRFTVYQPQHKPSLKSYMQAVDLVELKHHPIIVVVSGDGVWGNHLFTDIGDINIKEDIMAPLFPPIATHLADNPKIFLFMIRSSSSERYSALHFMEPISENYIVGYIACDNSDDIRRAGDIVQDKLAHPSMSVQEIFTSISDELPPHTTMTVIDRLKGPVYLHPRGPELIETHSESQDIPVYLSDTQSRYQLMKTHGRRPPTFTHSRTQGSSEESDTLSRVRQRQEQLIKEMEELETQGSSELFGFLSRLGELSTAAKEPDIESLLLEQPIKKLKTELSPKQSKGVPKQAESSDEL